MESNTEVTDKCRKGVKIAKSHMTPNTLMMKWAKAARFAWTLATAAARLAVIVVPIFSPIIMAAASS